ncbi:ectonucleoside triphosphate diphosphohydrolase 1-like [Chiloscyllium plagiosum]|uniref:ectonucleoside triphosphate diphosphohydrolase 1-like n=1 Tax=Chiloscyllium plagiosum TaxID=36176 RepID=UPI001CB84326|nr:ectonucleoside triphosphate diphosphohydrolase 1-like [Chiloscyllium plagiosum]
MEGTDGYGVGRVTVNRAAVNDSLVGNGNPAFHIYMDNLDLGMGSKSGDDLKHALHVRIEVKRLERENADETKDNGYRGGGHLVMGINRTDIGEEKSEGDLIEMFKIRCISTLPCFQLRVEYALSPLEFDNLKHFPSLFQQYGIVIDAGSSRTTLYVYKWPAGKENNTGIVSEHSKCNVKGAGISSYASNLSQVGNSLKPCLDETVKSIPAHRHAETPLYLGATAGMRLLK